MMQWWVTCFKEFLRIIFSPHVAGPVRHDHQAQAILFSIARFLGFLEKNSHCQGVKSGH